MHAPSAYELYLMREQRKYGLYNVDDNDCPAWFTLEWETYNWIFYLSRRIREPLYNTTVSKQMLERVAKIPTIRFLRYRDISPSLKKAISEIAMEFASLHEDLKSPEMWIRPHLLSKAGLKRWKRTAEIVEECSYVDPDPEWRENWEKENVVQ